MRYETSGSRDEPNKPPKETSFVDTATSYTSAALCGVGLSQLVEHNYAWAITDLALGAGIGALNTEKGRKVRGVIFEKIKRKRDL